MGPPEVPSEFSIVATGELSELDVSLIDGATFVRCGPTPEDAIYDYSRVEYLEAQLDSNRGDTERTPHYNLSNVIRLLDDGSPDNATATTGIRVFGSWPRDAWREDDSTGERGDFNQRYATWKGDHWEAVDPHGPKNPGFWSKPIAILPFGDTWLIAAEPWGPPIDEKGRGLEADTPECFFFFPSGPSKWPPPESSTLCAPRKPGDFCDPHAEDFASLNGKVLAIGQFCGRTRPPIEIAVWKPGRTMTRMALPLPPSKKPETVGAGGGHLLSVGADDLYAVASIFAEDISDTAVGWHCTASTCAAFAMPADIHVDPSTTLFLLDGALALREHSGVWRMKSVGVWEKERLDAPVDSIANAPDGAWAVVGGRLFRRGRDGAWTEYALPRAGGAALRAERVVARGADVWVVAKFGTTICGQGRALLRHAAKRAPLYCTSEATLVSDAPADAKRRPVVTFATVGEGGSVGTTFPNLRKELDAQPALVGKPLIRYQGRYQESYLAFEGGDDADVARIAEAIVRARRVPQVVCAKPSEIGAAPAPASPSSSTPRAQPTTRPSRGNDGAAP
jgi:hypothetical protein